MAAEREAGRVAVNLSRRMFFGIADQGVLSLTSFLVGVWLIRTTGKNEYGFYLAGTSAYLYVMGLQNALITTQMTVLAPFKGDGERDGFCGALLKGQWLLFFIPLCLLATVAFGLDAAGIGRTDTLLLTGTVAVISPGILSREFFRSYLFQRQAPHLVLAIDLLFCALWLGGMTAGRFLFPAHLHLLALAASGMASLLAALAASRLSPLPLGGGLDPALSALGDAWRGGRWALAGMTVTWLQDQSYIYLLGMLAGVGASAEAGAARLLLVPATLIQVGAFRVLMPRWVRLRRLGRVAELQKQVRRTALAASTAIVAYAFLICAVRDSALAALYPAAYGNIGFLVVLWGGLCALQAARSSYSAGLQVMERFRLITLANTASAAVVVLLGVFLARSFGAAGGIMAQIAGELTLTLLLGRGVNNVN